MFGFLLLLILFVNFHLLIDLNVFLYIEYGQPFYDCLIRFIIVILYLISFHKGFILSHCSKLLNYLSLIQVEQIISQDHPVFVVLCNIYSLIMWFLVLVYLQLYRFHNLINSFSQIHTIFLILQYEFNEIAQDEQISLSKLQLLLKLHPYILKCFVIFMQVPNYLNLILLLIF